MLYYPNDGVFSFRGNIFLAVGCLLCKQQQTQALNYFAEKVLDPGSWELIGARNFILPSYLKLQSSQGSIYKPWANDF